MRTCAFLSSSKAFFLSLEATLSLLAVCFLASTLLMVQQEDYSDVMVYKQASDFLEVVVRDSSLESRDVGHMQELLDTLGLEAEVVFGDDVLIAGSFEGGLVLERMVVTKELEYKKAVVRVRLT